MDKKTVELEDFDFGFEAVDESEIDQITGATNMIGEYKVKADQLYTAIMALLKNLEKNPEKEYIRWPNRAESVKNFRIKIEEIMNGNQ